MGPDDEATSDAGPDGPTDDEPEVEGEGEGAADTGEGSESTGGAGTRRERTVLRRVAVAAGVGLIVLVLLLSTAAATGVIAQPAVTDVTTEWAETSEEDVALRSTVTVRNPNPVGIPGVVDVEYDVYLNDVRVGGGREAGVELSPGENGLRLRTDVDGDRIGAWWGTHVNAGENTTLVVDPVVTGPGFRRDLPNRTRTFRTDVLGAFEDADSRSVAVGNESLFTVVDRSARWGEGTADRTPLLVDVTVRNDGDRPLNLSPLSYRVRLGEVVVGNGTTVGDARVPAGATRTVTVAAAVDNDRLAEWFPGHVARNETSVLGVSPGVVDSGERYELASLARRVRIETAILADRTASRTPLSGASGPSLARSDVVSTDRSFTVDAGTTRVRASTTTDNPNPPDSLVTRAVDVSVRSTATVNGVRLFEEQRSLSLPSGRATSTTTVPVSNESIRRWWVSHVNADERSVVRTSERAVADLIVTERVVRERTAERVVESDIAAGFVLERPRTVSVAGRQAATVTGQRAEWGRANATTTPLSLRYAVDNQASDPLTVVAAVYEVRVGETVFGAGRSRVDVSVPAGERRSVPVRLDLDTQRVDDWWVGHVERGQRSPVTADIEAVVEVDGERRRLSVSPNDTTAVTTDLLGTDDDTTAALGREPDERFDRRRRVADRGPP